MRCGGLPDSRRAMDGLHAGLLSLEQTYAVASGVCLHVDCHPVMIRKYALVFLTLCAACRRPLTTLNERQMVGSYDLRGISANSKIAADSVQLSPSTTYVHVVTKEGGVTKRTTGAWKINHDDGGDDLVFAGLSMSTRRISKTIFGIRMWIEVLMAI